MGAAWFGGFLLNPLVLVAFLICIAGLSAVHFGNARASPVIRSRRIVPAYLVALVVCALISAAVAYVSPEEALLRWKVSPENYWAVQMNEFVLTFTFTAYVSFLGIAIVGLPIIMTLGRRGFATIPIVLLAAVIVSLTVTILLTVGDDPPFRHFFALAKGAVFGHLAVALGFCVGAGLPWRQKSA